MLSQVFGHSTVTGHLYHASTQLPATFEDEQQKEEEFLTFRDKTQSSSSKKKHITKELELGFIRDKKEYKMTKLDSCIEMGATSLTARVERDQAMANKYKLESKDGLATSDDPYSVEICMIELEKIENVSDISYGKVVEKFTEDIWRKIFMNMSSERRRAWVQSLG